MISMKKRAEENIIETFLSLLPKMPLEKITVTKIVEATGINRRTFYDYFYSKECLIETVDTRILGKFQHIFGDLSEAAIPDSHHLVEQGKPLPHNLAICEHIKDHQHYYLIRLKDDAFVRKFTGIITGWLATFSNDTNTNAYLSYGTIGYLKEWLTSQCAQPIEEVAVSLANAGFHTVIRGVQKVID